jgi:hypothetical protein
MNLIQFGTMQQYVGGVEYRYDTLNAGSGLKNPKPIKGVRFLSTQMDGVARRSKNSDFSANFKPHPTVGLTPDDPELKRRPIRSTSLDGLK